ncbi:MAG: integral rane sensor hybrid histidine kinase [Brevundimonas sp.]|nr:integral rane sensor hybrid histidine kinase [Brevundimonas sp.]
MTTSGYAMVAQTRSRELGSRLGLAAFIGAVAWILAPSVWPVAWIIAVVLTQAIDWVVCRPLRLAPDQEPSLGLKIASCVIASLSVAVYSGITAYLWFNGGEAGRIFAMVQAAGGLLHVSLHMHHTRPLLMSAVVPHALYFMGLPVATAIMEHNPAKLLITLGGVLYMSHLIVAVRQSSLTTSVLQEANREARDQRSKADAASAAKSDFLAVISHEIRTPMNAVISAANLLRRTRLDAEQREHVMMLIDAGDVLVGLLNDVLDFSKIEAGKMQFENAPMEVRARLTSLQRLWQPRATANGVRLSFEIAEETPEWVSTDALRLQQILFNLLSNAVKFTQDGEVAVAVGWDASASVLLMQVTDTGCGIPEDRLVHIFDSFEQADAGTTRRYGGTGLGLPISRRLAELMGGDLTVASVVGQGSNFSVRLPVEAVAPVAVSQDKAQRVADASALKGRHILAADDHAVNRRILSLLLEPHGCILTLVENGAEAVAACEDQKFDAILMDMQMPVMDGLEASRRIRDGGANRQTALIALTANAMDVHRAAWGDVGAQAFLTKPIDPVLLARTLAEACDSGGQDAADTLAA